MKGVLYLEMVRTVVYYSSDTDYSLMLILMKGLLYLLNGSLSGVLLVRYRL